MSRFASDDGSAVVEFVLVSILLVTVLLGVLQLTLALHVRNTVVDAAGEGARYGALAQSSPAAGAARTSELVATALSPRYGENVTAEVVERDGLVLVEVTVRAPLPVLGLLGPGGTLTASGRAVQE
ncbi:TadE/TadG family type IV pilus assembly protein [Georgenia sp. H159]|uniref:TadE/TadG family type IV pilus assembly protein n=1 Tax=Georgenia sp. H159 TaxID=3076115 RepID=UPI002D77179D|nr:TadE/TadG family type IV pilus assembly protein [Georgenia sp. H159]